MRATETWRSLWFLLHEKPTWWPGIRVWCPLLEVYGILELSENVSRLALILMVARAKERYPQHCVEISCLSISYDWASETNRVIAAPLVPPEWKWDFIACDFVTHLPPSHSKVDTVWVIVNKLMKLEHFIPIRTTIWYLLWPDCTEARLLDSVEFPKRLYQIGTLGSLLPSRDPSGQVQYKFKRTIQILKDMLSSCLMDFCGCWEEHIPLVEFAYNNTYQANIGMTTSRHYMEGHADH